LSVTLVIAEKFSMAEKIRAGLKGAQGYKVVAASGHLLELAEPDSYLPDSIPLSKKGNKIWRAEDLPIIPGRWVREAKSGGNAHTLLRSLLGELKQATTVIHAGDPDREGQLIVDSILERAGFKGKVMRVWLKSLDADSVKRAFDALKPNPDYKGLMHAADARAKADWLVGMNLTRAWTIMNRQLVSIGRVQTPTLGLIVQRHHDIARFVSVKFYLVHAVMKGGIEALYDPTEAQKDEMGMDVQGRLVDEALALRIKNDIHGKAVVVSFVEEEKITHPPLPFDLKGLQSAANRRFGLSAQEALDMAQALYVEELATYPRTESEYLPESQHGDGVTITSMLALAGILPDHAKLNTSLRHKVWNDDKTGSHHAIIPTGVKPSGLSGVKAMMYRMVALAYAALFMPPAVDVMQTATFKIGDRFFVAKGKRVISKGWRALYEGEKDGDDEATTEATSVLPVMKTGDVVDVTEGRIQQNKTTPPPVFTEASLLSAMGSIHLYVKDPAIRKTLKDTAGIGTPATRASIIESLLARQFIERVGKGKTKKIHPTEKGVELIGALGADNAIVKPDTTAQWEDTLRNIEEGRATTQGFLTQIEEFIREQIQHVTCMDSSPQGGVQHAPCIAPGCSGTLTRLESKKSPGRYFWRCDQKNAQGEPTHALVSDLNGVPGAVFAPQAPTAVQTGNEPACPTCKKTKTITANTSTGKPYFRCIKCGSAWWPSFDDPNTLGKKWSNK